MKKEFIQKLLLISFGILFLISGIIKSLDTQSFSKIFMLYGFTSMSHFAPILASLEIVLGLCLILAINIRLTSLITGILVFLLTVIFLYALVFKGIKECGCMGDFIKIRPFTSIVRNVIIIAGSLWIYHTYKETLDTHFVWKRWVVYVIGAFVFCLSGFTYARPLVNLHKSGMFKTESDGRLVKETVFRPFIKLVEGKRSAIFLFDTRCTACWNNTENVINLKKSGLFNNCKSRTI